MTISLQTINSASMTELKAFAATNDVFIQGDKRRKATWVESITDFLVEGGAMEEIANQADIDNGVTTFTQSEPFTCAYPLQSVSDFIDLSIYAPSPTTEAELEPITSELPNTTFESLEPAQEPVLAFNQGGSNITPMVMVLYTLAIIIVPVAILVGWLSNVSIKVVGKALPLIDLAITTTLEYLINLVEFCIGSDYDKYSDSYMEIKHLLRN